MKLKGHISISRTTSSHEDDFINLELTDQSSRTRFVSGRIDMKDFAKLITGMGGIEIDLEVGGLDLLGKKHEVKSEDIAIGPYPTGSDFKTFMLPLVAPHEVNGWKASAYDIKHMNDHHLSDLPGGKYTYTVNFHRYV